MKLNSESIRRHIRQKIAGNSKCIYSRAHGKNPGALAEQKCYPLSLVIIAPRGAYRLPPCPVSPQYRRSMLSHSMVSPGASMGKGSRVLENSQVDGVAQWILQRGRTCLGWTALAKTLRSYWLHKAIARQRLPPIVRGSDQETDP